MINSIKGILRKKVLHNLAIVFTESAVSKLFSFLLVIVIARMLGPEEFGVYSLVTVSIFFLTAFIDFGMENTAIRFSAHHQSKREEIFGVYFLCKTAALIFLLLFIFFLPGLVLKLPDKFQSTKYFYIIFMGSVIESYLFIITTYWQSLERFFIRALINTGVYFLRLVLIFALLRLKVFNLKLITLFFAFSGLPFLLLFLRYLFRFLNNLIKRGIPNKLLTSMLHYEKWIVIGAIPMIIMTRIDFYIVVYFLSFKEAGLYNSAVELTGILAVILMAFRKVLFPKVVKYDDVRQIKTYISKVHKLLFLNTILCLLIVPFSKYIISFFLGVKYIPASGILQILLFSFLFTFWNVMLSIIFYSLGNSKLMAIGAYIQLAFFILCSFMFVPAMGMKGAAWSRFISDALYLGFVLYYLPKIIPLSTKILQDRLKLEQGYLC